MEKSPKSFPCCGKYQFIGLFIHPRPVGVVHGDCDGTVPVNHAEKLFDAAWEPKKLTILRGAGHQLRKDPRIMQVLRDWLSAVC
jgi:fermentation-respiration switch protein FrsA (DUF1100 family)